MGKLFKMGDTKTEDITYDTMFIHYHKGEDISSFLDRILKCKMDKTDRDYENNYMDGRYNSKFVADIDGVLIDVEDIDRIVKIDGNLEDFFEKIKQSKEKIDEEYGIINSQKQDSRKTVMLSPCSGLIPHHHAEAVKYAKKKTKNHFFVTSSHMGTFDVDQLMQISEEQIGDYIDKVYEGYRSIYREFYEKYEFEHNISELKKYISSLPEEKQAEMINRLYSEIIMPKMNLVKQPELMHDISEVGQVVEGRRMESITNLEKAIIQEQDKDKTEEKKLGED